MKSFYAEQINNLLQDYYFNCENDPRTQKNNFSILANGIQHLHGVAFCGKDVAAAAEIKPFVIAVINGDVPQPIYIEA